MSATIAVLKRELELAFRSPIAWVAMSVFHLFNGLAWRNLVSAWQHSSRVAAAEGGVPFESFPDAVLAPYFLGIAFSLVLFLPFLTMRVFADERRTGFEDLLFSLPLSAHGLLLGKLAGAAILLALLVGPALLLPLACAGVAPVEPGTLAAGALGTLLLGLAAIAIGLWASSLTDSQPVAAAMTLGVLLLLFFADRLWEPAGALSLRAALEPFGRGVASLKATVFLALTAGAFAFLAARGLDDRRRLG